MASIEDVALTRLTFAAATADLSMTKSDPTKDPEFQKVVQTFLHTKPQPHKPKKKPGRSIKKKPTKSAKR
jgi:hypothetical protein